MSDTAFDERVRSAYERVAALRDRAQVAAVAAGGDVPDVMAEAFEELATAFEELSVAQEELRVQNETLAEAEAAAVLERDRYKDLFEFAPSGYLVTDPNGVVADTNRAVRDLLGVGAHRSLAGKPLAVFVAAVDRAKFLALLGGLAGGSPDRAATLRLQPRPEGAAPRVVKASVVPYRDPATRAPMLRWQFQDATDEWLAVEKARRLELELDAVGRDRQVGLAALVREKEAAERRLQFVAESGTLFAASLDLAETLGQVGRRAVPTLGDWCYVELADPDGGTRRYPVAMSDDGTAALLPSPDAGPRGRAGLPDRTVTVSDVAAPPADLPPVEADRVRTFAALGWRAGVWLPLVAGGEAVGGLAVGAGGPRDWSATDLRVAEEFARQAAAALHNVKLVQALRAADKRKDEFLAVLAHELRNPLTPIRNAVQILKLRTGQDPDLQRTFAVIDRQAMRMNRLIDDLLDVARIAQGKVHLQPEPVDLRDAVDGLAEAARPRASGRGVRLSVAVPADPVRVEADPGRLDQVVGNLLDNAVKFTEAGGEVAVEVGREDGAGVVRVRDSGVGIAPDLLPHVFDLFVQADGTPGGSQAGLGIGLALVKRLVQLHGGTVEARSGGPGTGTEFVVRLPVADPDPAAGPAAVVPEPALAELHGPPTAAGGPPLRVLVVDDDRAAAVALARDLRGLGHAVRTADSVDAAVREARAEPADLVLVADLGDARAVEVARRARDWPETAGAVLVYLAQPGADAERRAKEAGCGGHLLKPVTPAALGRLLALVAGREVTAGAGRG